MINDIFLSKTKIQQVYINFGSEYRIKILDSLENYWCYLWLIFALSLHHTLAHEVALIFFRE